MGLKGVNDGHSNPLDRRGMRTSWTQSEGGGPAHVYEARVVDVDLVNWTVDVRTQFDDKFFPNVQVASDYLHPNRGEGFYVMPEVNAKCLLCIPSDGPPPFVLAFIMPVEEKGEIEEEGGSNEMGSSTFRGGRPRAKPGDMYLRGRDGNFVILHRGGVLQVGSTELAQRIYIPLGNIIADISQNYEHHNIGGNIGWGISSSSTEENPETLFFQTFRTGANQAKADVRLTIGKVSQPTPEPAGGEGSKNSEFGLGVGDDNPIVCELCLAPDGFEAVTGSPSNAQNNTNLKFTFDKNGNTFFRAEGNVNVRVKGRLNIAADGNADFSTKGTLRVVAKEKVRIEGRGGVDILSESGPVVLNGGDTPVAAVGSAVDVIITLPIPVNVGGVPGVIVPGPNARLSGFSVNGVSTVLVPKPG